MKRIGILLLLTGIGLGLVYPWAKLNFLGQQITEVQLSNLDFNAKQKATFTLNKENNPVRARFLIKYKRNAYLPPVSIPLFVRIDGPNYLSIATKISFSTDGRTTGPEQGEIASSKSVDFNVKGSGLHQISLELAPNQNVGLAKKPDIENITVKFIANAASTDNPYQIWAIMFGVLGFYLLMRSKHKRTQPPSQPRWGRGKS